MLGSPSALSSANRKPVLIVLSHLRWDFVFQRPQQLLTRAAAEFDVFFVEEPILTGTVASFREFSRQPGVTVIQPTLPEDAGPGETIFHQGDVVERIAASAGHRPIYLWYYTPAALSFGHRVSADLVIFDKMDELSAFAFAPTALRALEASLMETADVVFTGGASLQASAVKRRPDAHCFPSSIDAGHFGGARNRSLPDPADQAGIAGPRIGFFGVIDERMDLDLVAATAARRPDWQFIMIGPTAKIEPSRLPVAANIHWMGPRDYADLPPYLAHWDAAWMPFALNESTRYISPTKTPEFLAAGLPVVSTPIHDVVEPYGRLALVKIASHVDEVVECIEEMLANEADAALAGVRLAAVDAHLAGNSWDATWAAMREVIREEEQRELYAPGTIAREVSLV